MIIFGASRLASLLWYCLTQDSPHEVVGFTVDASHRQGGALHGLPLIDFEVIEQHFPPPDHGMIVALGVTEMNSLRQARCTAARQKGYKLESYISSRAMTWPDLIMGDNCLIFDGAILQPFTTLGEGVIIRSGVHISHHNTIGDFCYFGPRVCLGGSVTVGNHCFLGLNATVCPRVSIGDRCFVAAGAVLNRDADGDHMYVGAPARRRPLPAREIASSS